MREVFQNLYDEIESRLRANFGKIYVHQEDPRQKDALNKLPAFLIEMTDISPIKPTGTGEIEVLTRWNIRLVIQTDNAEDRIKARAACALIAGIFSEKILVKNTYPVRYLGSHDDNFGFVAELESWVSEFDIGMVIGHDQYEDWDMYPDVMKEDEA